LRNLRYSSEQADGYLVVASYLNCLLQLSSSYGSLATGIIYRLFSLSTISFHLFGPDRALGIVEIAVFIKYSNLFAYAGFSEYFASSNGLLAAPQES
jgi:hypothetical protein